MTQKMKSTVSAAATRLQTPCSAVNAWPCSIKLSRFAWPGPRMKKAHGFFLEALYYYCCRQIIKDHPLLWRRIVWSCGWTRRRRGERIPRLRALPSSFNASSIRDRFYTTKIAYGFPRNLKETILLLLGWKMTREIIARRWRGLAMFRPTRKSIHSKRICAFAIECQPS